MTTLPALQGTALKPLSPQGYVSNAWPACGPAILTHLLDWHSPIHALLQLLDLLLHLLGLREMTHEVEVILRVGPMNVC